MDTSSLRDTLGFEGATYFPVDAAALRENKDLLPFDADAVARRIPHGQACVPALCGIQLSRKRRTVAAAVPPTPGERRERRKALRHDYVTAGIDIDASTASLSLLAQYLGRDLDAPAVRVRVERGPWAHNYAEPDYDAWDEAANDDATDAGSDCGESVVSDLSHMSSVSDAVDADDERRSVASVRSSASTASSYASEYGRVLPAPPLEGDPFLDMSEEDREAELRLQREGPILEARFDRQRRTLDERREGEREHARLRLLQRLADVKAERRRRRRERQRRAVLAESLSPPPSMPLDGDGAATNGRRSSAAAAKPAAGVHFRRTLEATFTSPPKAIRAVATQPQQQQHAKGAAGDDDDFERIPTERSGAADSRGSTTRHASTSLSPMAREVSPPTARESPPLPSADPPPQPTPRTARQLPAAALEESPVPTPRAAPDPEPLELDASIDGGSSRAPSTSREAALGVASPEFTLSGRESHTPATAILEHSAPRDDGRDPERGTAPAAAAEADVPPLAVEPVLSGVATPKKARRQMLPPALAQQLDQHFKQRLAADRARPAQLEAEERPFYNAYARHVVEAEAKRSAPDGAVPMLYPLPPSDAPLEQRFKIVIPEQKKRQPPGPAESRQSKPPEPEVRQGASTLPQPSVGPCAAAEDKPAPVVAAADATEERRAPEAGDAQVAGELSHGSANTPDVRQEAPAAKEAKAASAHVAPREEDKSPAQPVVKTGEAACCAVM